jgi:hypothetical protein
MQVSSNAINREKTGADKEWSRSPEALFVCFMEKMDRWTEMRENE